MIKHFFFHDVQLPTTFLQNHHVFLTLIIIFLKVYILVVKIVNKMYKIIITQLIKEKDENDELYDYIMIH